MEPTVRTKIKKIWNKHILRHTVGYASFDPLEETEDKGPFVYYRNKIVVFKSFATLKKGQNIITPQGVGEVYTTFPFYGPSDSRNKRVEVWLQRKHYKAFFIDETYQYAVWHAPLNKHILLSNSCYRYIFKPEEVVKYRITSNGYAMLADSEKEKRTWIKIFNEKRGGISLLIKLLSNGYKIIKE